MSIWYAWTKCIKQTFFFYPDIPFDNGLDKFDGNELEKEALQSAITKQKKKNYFKTHRYFWGH